MRAWLTAIKLYMCRFMQNKQTDKPWLLPVVHPIGWLIVRVNRVFISNLFGPFSLLIHVGPTHQLGSKVPTLTSRQFYIHSYIVIGLLQNKRRRTDSWKSSPLSLGTSFKTCFIYRADRIPCLLQVEMCNDIPALFLLRISRLNLGYMSYLPLHNK